MLDFFLLSFPYILITHYLLKQICHEIKTLEIKTSKLSNLVLPSNTILSCFFLPFFIIDLYFLISVVIAHIFNPTAGFVIPTGTKNTEANAEIETQLVTVEAKNKQVFNVL